MTSWVEVSGQRLFENYRTACGVAERSAGGVMPVLAVIKADAYGHGAAVCAPVLARAGAKWLGVTDAVEGMNVRATLSVAGGLEAVRILVMCGGPAEDAAIVVTQGLTPVVWRRDQMEALAGAAGTEPVKVHLEIDTGMSRQGCAVAELRPLLRWIAGQPKLSLDGVLTHFASAEIAGSEQTIEQRRKFEDAVRIVVEEGLRPAWVHAGNTSGIDNGADNNGADGEMLAWLGKLAKGAGAQAMVRSGLGLYGYCLPLEGLVGSDGPESVRLRAVIQPVMTWKARIIDISEVESGARIGYSGTFVAPRRMRLALLPVGYADGLRRELSCASGGSGGWVMIAGQRAPIVGRVSMNLTTVDVTDIADVAAGNEVVLLGEGFTAEDHAALAGTIAYEILCGIRASAVLR